MPFAMAIIKEEADLAECPYMTEEEAKALKNSIIKSDWREELILNLKEEVKGISFSEIAKDLGTELKDSNLIIKCLGREFEISPAGEITTQGHITPWIKILLLHYIRTRGKGELSGRWVSYSSLKAGIFKALSFLAECENPLKELFEKDFDTIETILTRFGAERRNDFPTTNAWRLCLLPKIPVLILYWQQEDEFESKVKILFDSTADRFLDAESIIFLVEGLVKNLEQLRNNKSILTRNSINGNN